MNHRARKAWKAGYLIKSFWYSDEHFRRLERRIYE